MDERNQAAKEQMRHFFCFKQKTPYEIPKRDWSSDVCSSDLRDALVPKFRERFDDYIADIQREGIARGLMVVGTRAGEERVWEYTNTLRTEGVAAPIVRGVAHDVTEQRRAEEAVRRSEAE